MRILIIDNHPVFLEKLENALHKFNISIEQAATVEQALSLINEGKLYDILLIDMGVAGFENYSSVDSIFTQEKKWEISGLASVQHKTKLILQASKIQNPDFETVLEALITVLKKDIFSPQKYS